MLLNTPDWMYRRIYVIERAEKITQETLSQRQSYHDIRVTFSYAPHPQQVGDS